jgi:hypothetical protein
MFLSEAVESASVHALSMNRKPLNIGIAGVVEPRQLRTRGVSIMQLHCRNDFATMSTSFGALTHDLQDYGFKTRFESLPDSTIRLDTQGLLMRERPRGSSPLAYLL